MTEGSGRPTGSLPGTVVAAIVLAGFHAILGLFFPPTGLLYSALYGAGAVGAGLRAVWGYWLLVIVTATSWVLTLASGRIEVVSTTIALFILLMTPSARAAFRVGSGTR